MFGYGCLFFCVVENDPDPEVVCCRKHRKIIRAGVFKVGQSFIGTPLDPYVGKYLCKYCRQKILASKGTA